MKNTILVAGLALGAMACGTAAQAQEDYIGEVFMTGANFCPRGTAEANGQLLPIAQNSALFSLLGTMYGGDGRTTFALPDLRAGVPVHSGRPPGGEDVRMGQKGILAAGKPGKAGTNTVGIKYCIVMQGIFPSRS